MNNGKSSWSNLAFHKRFYARLCSIWNDGPVARALQQQYDSAKQPAFSGRVDTQGLGFTFMPWWRRALLWLLVPRQLKVFAALSFVSVFCFLMFKWWRSSSLEGGKRPFQKAKKAARAKYKLLKLRAVPYYKIYPGGGNKGATFGDARDDFNSNDDDTLYDSDQYSDDEFYGTSARDIGGFTNKAGRDLSDDSGHRHGEGKHVDLRTYGQERDYIVKQFKLTSRAELDLVYEAAFKSGESAATENKPPKFDCKGSHVVHYFYWLGYASVANTTQYMKSGSVPITDPKIYVIKNFDKTDDTKHQFESGSFVSGDLIFVPRHVCAGASKVVAVVDGKQVVLGPHAQVVKSMSDMVVFRKPVGAKGVRKPTFRAPIEGEMLLFKCVDKNGDQQTVGGECGDREVKQSGSCVLYGFTGSTVDGFCGGLYYAASDGAIVGWHGVGSPGKYNKFYPFSESFAEEFRAISSSAKDFQPLNFKGDAPYIIEWSNVINDKMANIKPLGVLLNSDGPQN